MPSQIGEIPIPEPSRHFLRLRAAVRGSLPATGTVIGCSGGPDSLSLVAAAVAETPPVTALIVDHGLAATSGTVAARAARTATRLGAVAEIVRITIDPAEIRRRGLEAAAREQRWRVLVDRAARLGLDLAVAHTMDDLAENQLLCSLRGKPNSMRAVSCRDGVAVHRPFLSVRRADTTGAMKELGVGYWTDPMNSDPAYLRVGIRHRVLPLLAETTGGDPVEALARAAVLGADNAGFVDDTAAALARQLVDGDGALSVAAAGHPAAVRRSLITRWLARHRVEWSGGKIAAVDRLLTDWHGQGPVAVGKAADGSRLVVARKGGKLTVSGS